MSRARPALLVVLFAAALAGCLRRETDVQRGDREGVLLRGVGYEVADLDPQLASGTAEQAVVSALFEGLVSEDPANLHPVPGVASSWTVSADGLTYTFFLRPEARWSDGRPVTAGDFVESWQRILTPSLGAENANLLYVLQGAEAFHKGLQQDFAEVGAAALDEHTLRVTLAHPAPYFLSLLTHWCWYPVPVAAISANGPKAQRGNAWTRAGRLVGNGPFVLRSWEPDQVIVVEKSPTYWDSTHVRLKAIRFFPIDSLQAEEAEFRSGQLHITDALPAGRAEAYRKTASPLLRIDPYLGTYFYRINTRRPCLGDARIRRALSLAIDRAAIVEKILRGGQEPAAAFTPPGMDGYDPPGLLRTDLAQARQLLVEAGYPGGQGLPAMELRYNNSENHRLVAEAVQEMWRRGLGVDVRLANQEEKTLLAERRTGDFQILKSDWIADYADPASFLNVWRGDSGNNFTGWSSPDYDSLLFAAARTADPAARAALLKKAEQILLSEAPVIPIYHYTHVFLIQPSVHGWHPNLLDHHPYKAVWLGD